MPRFHMLHSTCLLSINTIYLLLHVCRAISLLERKRYAAHRVSRINMLWSLAPRQLLRSKSTVLPWSTHIRTLRLAPPYLLDDYIPRHQLLSSVDASLKRSEAYAHLRECNLCPRLCGVNRYEKTGICLIGAETVKIGTIAPHFGEGE